ncbi:MAG: hypothetical protein V4725_08920 [Bacteroidota bacterium]
MKAINYLALVFCSASFLLACEKKEYEVGKAEFEHHYYAAYIPNNNSAVAVQRTQAALLKFPVQFYSSFSRSYDAVGYYTIFTTGIINPAVIGQDFNVVDKNGNVLAADNDRFSFTFPKAEKVMDTIYIKLLNSTVPGARKMEVQIVENKTDQFYVDIFSTAFRRPVEIK